MDSVRFGRALGIGARLAAKTLVSAADAATAPNPSAPQGRSASRTQSASQTGSAPQTRPSSESSQPHAPSAQLLPSAAQRNGQNAARSSGQIRNTRRGFAQGSRRFGEAAWGPVVKLSGVLWLEFTGVFFGIFALFAAGGAWKLRATFHQTSANTDGRTHFELALGMAIVFGYFCLSSFLRANRRSRRS